MFRAMGDFHRSVEIARFLPMQFTPIYGPYCLTISHRVLQCSEQWVIGGNCAIFTDDIPPKLPDHFPSQKQEQISSKFQNNGRFSPIAGNRAIFTDYFCPHIDKHPKDCHRFLCAVFRAMGDFHQSVEIARFLQMIILPNRQTICHPKDRHNFFCNVLSNGRFSPIRRWKSRDFYR